MLPLALRRAPLLLPGLLDALLLLLLVRAGCLPMRALMVMVPVSVNFTALLTRLFNTCSGRGRRGGNKL
jgi:hypothetical protein